MLANYGTCSTCVYCYLYAQCIQALQQQYVCVNFNIETYAFAHNFLNAACLDEDSV